MVVLNEAMDRVGEREKANGVAGRNVNTDLVSERRKLSVDSHELDRAHTCWRDKHGDDSCLSSPVGKSADLATVEESRPTSVHPTPDQIEVAACLLAHKGTVPISSVDQVVQSVTITNVEKTSPQSLPVKHHFSATSGKKNDLQASKSPKTSSQLNNSEQKATQAPTPAPILGTTEIKKVAAGINAFAGATACRVPEAGPTEYRVPAKVITVKTLPPMTSKAKVGEKLRRGKWTVEEEAYVARVIQDFNSGYLDAPAGTTLRTYLSEKLKCDPMRITKKFTGEACIGKRVFHPAVRSPSNSGAIDKAQAELEALERRWRRRLEMQQRESAKKAAASAAVAAAASSGRGPNALTHNRSELNSSSAPSINVSKNPVAKTASWLDRAKNVLKEPSAETSVEEETQELENQIQEVQRLIHEGPIIQQASHELPQMIDQAASDRDDACSSFESGDDEPADKRMRTAEDAEALVGFLRSVRASAAQGETF